jgi:MFS family permease
LFFAQAVATGFVGRAANAERAAASGLYLSAYYCGGLVGTGLVGWLYESFGWSASVAGDIAAVALACWLGKDLAEPAFQQSGSLPLTRRASGADRL